MRNCGSGAAGGAAHGALAAFTEWRGVKLLGALAQGMYWFLVMRAELGIARGDLAAVIELAHGCTVADLDHLAPCYPKAHHRRKGP